MLMHQLLFEGAMRHPDKTAFTWVDRRSSLTYAHAASSVEHMAGALAHLGIKKGDRVTVFAHNGMDYLLAMFGAWRVGAIAALVNVKFKDDLAYYFADHQPRLVIYTHDMHDVVHAAAHAVPGIEVLLCMDGGQPGALSLPELLKARFSPPADPGDEQAVAHLSYTSGTTGKPKAACLSHEPTMRATRCIAERLRITGQDVSFGPTALSSSYQLVGNILPALAHGASVNIMRFWTAEGGWDALEAAKATILVGNPTILEEVRTQSVLRGRPPGQLRMGLSGGGPVPVTLKRGWRNDLHLPLVESFGQSELGGFMAMGYPVIEKDDHKLMRVGPALPDKEVWMIGPDGSRLPPGQIGEIVLRGGFMWGYWGKPAQTGETLKDGLLRTGDLGLIDGDGYVTMRGRRSELLDIDGVQWFPRDVEEALCQQPGVRQAALIGKTDSAGKLAPCAFITCHSGAAPDLATLKQSVQAEVTYPLQTMSITVIDEFPMTPTGKIAKGELALRNLPNS